MGYPIGVKQDEPTAAAIQLHRTSSTAALNDGILYTQA